MGLDVETPAPPDLTNRSWPSDLDPTELFDSLSYLRREELEEILHDGAWHEAFQEWAEYSDLNEEEYHVLTEAGLIDQLDLYWDPVEETIQFEVPPIPDHISKHDGLARKARSELAELAQTVVALLDDAYVDWLEEGAGAEGWSEKTFGEESPLEES